MFQNLLIIFLKYSYKVQESKFWESHVGFQCAIMYCRSCLLTYQYNTVFRNLPQQLYDEFWKLISVVSE